MLDIRKYEDNPVLKITLGGALSLQQHDEWINRAAVAIQEESSVCDLLIDAREFVIEGNYLPIVAKCRKLAEVISAKFPKITVRVAFVGNQNLKPLLAAFEFNKVKAELHPNEDKALQQLAAWHTRRS